MIKNIFLLVSILLFYSCNVKIKNSNILTNNKEYSSSIKKDFSINKTKKAKTLTPNFNIKNIFNIKTLTSLFVLFNPLNCVKGDHLKFFYDNETYGLKFRSLAQNKENEYFVSSADLKLNPAPSPFTNINEELVLSKHDKDGNLLSSKKLGNNNSTIMIHSKLYINKNNSLYLLTNSFNFQEGYGIIISEINMQNLIPKISAKYTGINFDTRDLFFTSINDQGFVITTASTTGVIVFRINNDYSIKWEHLYHENGRFESVSAITNDINYTYITGWVDGFGPPGQNIYLLILNSETGNDEFFNVYGSNSQDIPNHIHLSQNGDIFITGVVRGLSPHIGAILKIDKNKKLEYALSLGELSVFGLPSAFSFNNNTYVTDDKGRIYIFSNNGTNILTKEFNYTSIINSPLVSISFDSIIKTNNDEIAIGGGENVGIISFKPDREIILANFPLDLNLPNCSLIDYDATIYNITEDIQEVNGSMSQEPLSLILSFFNLSCFEYDLYEKEFCFITDAPTNFPTITPTMDPTLFPTDNPTNNPDLLPTVNPTFSPTLDPTLFPTNNPTLYPTYKTTSTDVDTESNDGGLVPIAAGIIAGELLILCCCLILCFYFLGYKRMQV